MEAVYREPVEDLAERLKWLPVDETSLTGVPQMIAAELTPVVRYRRTPPSRTAINRLEYEFLAALAYSGWSIRLALTEAVNYWKGLRKDSGSFKRAYKSLVDRGLWECIEQRAGYARTAFVRLTPAGRALLARVGITAVLSEWETIEKRHRGGQRGQAKHTAMICAFQYHARRYGYLTEACPTMPATSTYEPDTRLTKDTAFYVEVQGRGGETWKRARKWTNQYREQGFVAICTDTRDQAFRLAREAQLLGITRGYVAMLEALVEDPENGLWHLYWTSPHMPIAWCTDSTRYPGETWG